MTRTRNALTSIPHVVRRCLDSEMAYDLVMDFDSIIYSIYFIAFFLSYLSESKNKIYFCTFAKLSFVLVGK